MDDITTELPKIEWVGMGPTGICQIALLIPEYNEKSRSDVQARLDYFHDLAVETQGLLDVIIIDDGSTDGSFSTIKEFKDQHPGSFHFASVNPNAKKVGALFLATALIKHDFVILSDFDTDLRNIHLIVDVIGILKNDDTLMGCYFRMLPVHGSGWAFRFQTLEYSIARSLYRLVTKEGSVPVMPGAGCCYKREVLIKIYNNHSGNWCGEDRESTLIGLKYGFRTFYKKDIIASTRPPIDFRTLLQQRIRWNLGFIETFHKENEYYLSQIRKGTRLGIRTLIDIFNVGFIVALPILSVFALAVSFKAFLVLAFIVYLSGLSWCGALFLISPNEVVELRSSLILDFFTYPIVKISLDFLAWTKAFLKFFRTEVLKHNALKNKFVRLPEESQVEL
jgi:cellulose synthase/poly-beta-1,6-N-acetylglucosamine synthase-like glycosyltransferase